jgi:hypothetical protein
MSEPNHPTKFSDDLDQEAFAIAKKAGEALAIKIEEPPPEPPKSPPEVWNNPFAPPGSDQALLVRGILDRLLDITHEMDRVAFPMDRGSILVATNELRDRVVSKTWLHPRHGR